MEFVDGMSLYRGYFAVNFVDPSGKLLWLRNIFQWLWAMRGKGLTASSILANGITIGAFIATLTGPGGEMEKPITSNMPDDGRFLACAATVEAKGPDCPSDDSINGFGIGLLGATDHLRARALVDWRWHANSLVSVKWRDDSKNNFAGKASWDNTRTSVEVVLEETSTEKHHCHCCLDMAVATYVVGAIYIFDHPNSKMAYTVNRQDIMSVAFIRVKLKANGTYTAKVISEDTIYLGDI